MDVSHIMSDPFIIVTKMYFMYSSVVPVNSHAEIDEYIAEADQCIADSRDDPVEPNGKKSCSSLLLKVTLYHKIYTGIFPLSHQIYVI